MSPLIEPTTSPNLEERILVVYTQETSHADDVNPMTSVSVITVPIDDLDEETMHRLMTRRDVAQLMIDLTNLPSTDKVYYEAINRWSIKQIYLLESTHQL